MILSTEKPKQIAILVANDDVKKGKTFVKFAFRYAIEETTIEQPTEEGQVEEVQGWKYEEYIAEQEFDLFLKDSIVDILSSLYTKIVPKLENLQNYASVELPKEFDIGSDE